jgi:hypothetical protein
MYSGAYKKSVQNVSVSQLQRKLFEIACACSSVLNIFHIDVVNTTVGVLSH